MLIKDTLYLRDYWGYRFDNVLIHSDVVLTRYAEDVIKSRMKEIKEFEEFDL